MKTFAHVLLLGLLLSGLAFAAYESDPIEDILFCCCPLAILPPILIAFIFNEQKWRSLP